MKFAACDSRRVPPVILSIHETRDAAWDDMDERMREDPNLPGNVAMCPEGKAVGDTLTFAEIRAAAEGS